MKRIFPYVVLLASFVLAGSAAYYSVFGLSKLFSSQATAVIILAGSLEASKLITASYLHRYWKQITTTIKIYMTIAVFILMCITSLGIYGFLVSAYQDTAYKFQNQETVINNLESKKTRYNEQLQQLVTEKQTVTNNITELTSALSNNVIQYTDRNGNQVRKTSSANRKAYETQLSNANIRLDDLTEKQTAIADSVTKIDFDILDKRTNSEVSAEIGPLKYIADITGSSMDSVVNWLIILLIMVFDPLAIILLISANRAFELKENKNDTQESIIEVVPETVSITPEPVIIEEIKPEPIIETPKIEPKVQPQPEILSYWNRLRNERAKRKK
jgi:hypothetical protein